MSEVRKVKNDGDDWAIERRRGVQPEGPGAVSGEKELIALVMDSDLGSSGIGDDRESVSPKGFGFPAGCLASKLARTSAVRGATRAESFNALSALPTRPASTRRLDRLTRLSDGAEWMDGSTSDTLG